MTLPTACSHPIYIILLLDWWGINHVEQWTWSQKNWSWAPALGQVFWWLWPSHPLSETIGLFHLARWLEEPMAQKSQYYSSFVKALWLEELAVGHGPTVMPRDHCSLGFPLLVTMVPGGCPGTCDVLSRTELGHQLILETSSSLCA